MEFILFVIGGVLLFAGAEFLVGGASALAARFGVSPITIGLTIVAYGTSLPEFIVSVDAALAGSGGVAMGNVLGSNICNIALVMGAAACIRPLSVNQRLLTREIPFLLLVSVVVIFSIYNGVVGRIEGVTLFSAGLFFTWALFRAAARQDRSVLAEIEGVVPDDVVLSASGAAKDFGKIILGLSALFFGGAWFVDGAVEIARLLGISETVIGLSLVAFGTSVPELVTVVVAVKKGEDDIGIGNLIGSNIFNLSIVLGGASSIAQVPFAGGKDWIDVAISLGLPLLLMPMLKRGKIARPLGVSLLSAYLIYLAFLFMTK